MDKWVTPLSLYREPAAALSARVSQAERLQWGLMQVLLAGGHKFLLLELDPDFVANIAKQAGFEYRIEESLGSMNQHLSVVYRPTSLLLFDAADPGNLGVLSRCQFYVDGKTGAVLQTPMSLANQKDRAGRMLPGSVRVQITKELPASFRT